MIITDGAVGSGEPCGACTTLGGRGDECKTIPTRPEREPQRILLRRVEGSPVWWAIMRGEVAKRLGDIAGSALAIRLHEYPATLERETVAAVLGRLNPDIVIEEGEIE